MSRSPAVPPPGRRALWPAVLGGALWLPYGVLEMLEPWGQDARYDEQLGYDVVLDRALFTLYSLPGALALLLCAAGLSSLVDRLDVRSRAARWAGRTAGALGIVSLLGVATAFDPAFTAGRIFGTLALGVGVLAAAWRAPEAWRLPLQGLGLLGVFLMPVWPLVFALGWLPRTGAAVVLAAHGLAWVVVGLLSPPADTPAIKVLRRPVGSALHALVGVDERPVGAPPVDRHAERVRDQRGGGLGVDRPADDAAGDHVEHDGAVDLSPPGSGAGWCR